MELFLTIIAFLPVVNAWALIWRNASDYPTTEHDTQPLPCKQINQTKGKEFNWDAQNGPWCIYFFTEANCTNGRGYECNGLDWNAPAAVDLLSFKIEAKSVSSSAATSVSTVTVIPSATDGTFPVRNATGSSLSGSQVTGVVIGTIAGAVTLALATFFLGQRYPRRSMETTAIADYEPATVLDQQNPLNDPSNAERLQIAANNPPTTAMQSRPQHRAELVGNTGTVELSDTHRVVEIAERDWNA
ncbi:hypothetical protein Asppvi_005346 [Aspergillus pseudoviridinutans]|uniref:Uncharacterized protein n=1 Tax=Aspergillus pseudoviridinutans TaxID=1517512 RepID=A0A9P3B834_9EURO|nr:uncharacterized protein Asppvi_005346 [Aspergillus pseudoviridinutans]GIJ86457.1 hypothetical protein Asppvi_005346 [Aspergillus pseudoviridinutans]